MIGTPPGRLVLAVAAAVSVLVVSACREEEQGRILIQEKGVYQGQADEPLDEEQLRELRFRTSLQKF